MTDCKHEHFSAEISVNRLGDGPGVGEIRNFIAEIAVACAACKAPFHFLGVPRGLSLSHPTTDVLATTLHAPIAPGPGPMPDRMTFDVGDAARAA